MATIAEHFGHGMLFIHVKGKTKILCKCGDNTRKHGTAQLAFDEWRAHHKNTP